MHDFLIGVWLLKSLKLLKRILGCLRAWERKRFNCEITKCFSATSSLMPEGWTAQYSPWNDADHCLNSFNPKYKSAFIKPLNPCESLNGCIKDFLLLGRA